MKRFVFKLQPMLNYREYLERVAQQKTAKAQMDVVLCEKQITDLKNTRDQHTQQIENELEQGISALEFRQYHNYLDAVETALEQEGSRKKVLSGILKEKLQELQKKTIDKKAMEFYRERLKAEYSQKIFALEQKEMDEISSLKTARKLSNEASEQ